MITVWCMNTGKHAPDSEVHLLKKQVDRHLSEPHIFQCVSEHNIDGIHRMPPCVDWKGWWGKLSLLGANMSHPRNLFLDLDVVITGELDPLVVPLSGNNQIRAIRNWAQSGHNSVQSSVFYWEGCGARNVPESFNPADAHWPPRNNVHWDNGQVAWGDQEWMTYLRDTGQLDVEYFSAEHVKSYKYHLRQGLTPDCRVAVFHGKPKPSEVGDDWVRECRR